MKVHFYATLRDVVGSKTIEVDLPSGATVRQLLDEILTTYPLLRHELFDPEGHLYRHVHVFINGRDVPYLEDYLDTTLQESDTVSIFPAVGGG